MTTIGFANFESLNAQRRLSDATRELSRSFERMSSGMRINRASDDPAGLAVAAQLNTDARIYSQAIRNVNDGVSALNIAQGAVGQLSGVLMQLRELATQAANGVFSGTQRLALDSVAFFLTKEYNRIISSTSFNNTSLFGDNFRNMRIQAGRSVEESIAVPIGDEMRRTVGQGLFDSTQTLGAYNNSADYGDLDGDGDLDLVASDGTNLRIFKNNGAGEFTAVQTFAGSDFTIGDFDGDGDLDILRVSPNQLELLKNDGGNFTASGALVNPGTVVQLGSGDFNNDGKLDYMMVFDSTDRIFIGFGAGDGTFSGGTSFTPNVTGVSKTEFQAIDLNGDGLLDIIDGDGSGAGWLTVYYNQGGGNFSTSASTSANIGIGYTLLGATYGDFNHDGRLDIFAVGDGAHLFTQNQDGSFTASTVQTGKIYLQVKSGDINGDGNLDVYALSHGFGFNTDNVFLGNGDGTFSSIEQSRDTVGGKPILADFTGDGVLDYLAFVVGESLVLHGAITSQSASIERFNLTTQDEAKTALSLLDSYQERLLKESANLGAHQSRLDAMLNNLASRRENYIAAVNRIIDADMAQESAIAIRNQILQQSAQAILGQANQSSLLVLDLLKSAG